MNKGVVAAAVVLLAGALVALLFLMEEDDGRGRRGAVPGAGARSVADSAPAPRTDEAESSGFRLSLLAPGGLPAARARLLIEDPVGGRHQKSAGRDGVFEWRDAGPGRFTLWATHAGAVAELGFEVTDPGVKDLGSLQLAQGIAIRGHAYDSHKNPLAGVRVEVIEGESRPTRLNLLVIIRRFTASAKVLHSTETGPDGAYEIVVPGPGTYSLRAWSDRWAFETVNNLKVSATVRGIDFYLFPAVSISGRVVDEYAAPVPGARLSVVSQSASFQGGIPKPVALSDAEGRFSLSVDQTEQLMLIARAEGFAMNALQEVRAPRDGLVIQMQRGAAFTLRVVEAGRQIPVPRAQVTLVYHTSLVSSKTDDQGRLFLPHLPTTSSGRGFGGQKMAIIEAEGFVPRQVNLGTLELRDGVLDAGTAELERGGVIRGTVRLRGTDAPVAGAAVRSLGGVDPELFLGQSGEAVSDEKGRFVLKGVPLGAVALLATHSDHLPDMGNLARLMGMFGGMRGEKQQGVFPEGKTEIELDAYLTTAATVEGTVLDPKGEPVVGAEVTLAFSEGDQMGLLTFFILGVERSTVSGPDGRFRLKQLDASKPVKLGARHRDFGPSPTLELDPAQTKDVVLKLVRPLSLEGRVLTVDGNAVAGARIVVKRKGGQGGMSPRSNPFEQGTGETRPALTDAKGAYVVRGAPAGELTVTANHLRYADNSAQVTAAAGSVRVSVPDIVLERGNVITGRVVGPDGEPLADASVRANLTASAEPLTEVRPGSQTQRGLRWARTRTDQDGKFELVGLLAGKFRVTANSSGLVRGQQEADTGGPPIELRLVEGASLEGRVTHGGEPVVGVSVTARRNNDWLDHAMTDGAGNFRLDELPPGESFTLQFQHAEYRTLQLQNVRAGGARRDYQLEAGGVIAGVVVDEAGAPVVGVTVNLNSLTRIAAADGVARGVQDSKNTQSGARGHFRIAGLTAEGYRISVASWNSDWILVGEAPQVSVGDLDVRLVVRKGLSIEGALVDAQGQPLAQTTIEARPEEGSGNKYGFSGEDGSFKISGLAEGTYSIYVHRGGQPQRVREGVTAGTTGLTLEVQ
jgi:protocatechuate 3,4-dioxygenase beta subunit